VTYTLPGGEPRTTSGTTTRANESFLSFPVWAAGDPNQTTVRVLVPDGFKMDLQGDLGEFREVDRDGQRMLEAVALDDPRSFFGQVFGRNDDGLITELAQLPDATAVVRAWPDDPEWAQFVVEAIENDVPLIEELTGLEWPAGDIEVIETVTPYLYGYGGWFNALSGQIEIGDQLERDLILHELGHAWFNEELIRDRWITEGLAEEYASRVIESADGQRPNPERPDLDDPVQVPLANWASPWTLSEDEAYSYEVFHYNASWWVIRQITDEVGLDAFATVLAGLRDDTMTYPGDGPAEFTTDPTQWTHFFDLLEFQAGATGLDELFGTYVVSDAGQALLVERRNTLGRYRELQAQAGQWTPPRVVRQLMSEWDFAAADAALELSVATVDARNEVDQLAAALGISADPQRESRFEMAASVDELASLLDDEQRQQAALAQLQTDRNSLIDEATAINTMVAFEATSLEAATQEVADQRQSIVDVAQLRTLVSAAAAELDVASPPWPTADGTTDFGAASALAEARLATLDELTAAATAADEARSLVERIGLWPNDTAAGLDDARAAFEADDLDQSIQLAGRVESLLERAGDAGRARLIWFAVIVVGMTLVSMIVRRAFPDRRNAQIG
jgi:hypothetical protein